MSRTDISRTIAVIACTIVMSATCVLGAVGPAGAGMGHAAATAAARLTA